MDEIILKSKPLKKRGIDELSVGELQEIVTWGNSIVYRLIKALSADRLSADGLELTKVLPKDAVQAVTSLAEVYGQRKGAAFLLDLPRYAKAQLTKLNEESKSDKQSR